MNRIIQSLLLCFCFGFFSILITEVRAAPGYGESTPKWPSSDIYALTGTLVTSTTEFSGSLYIYATGASSGLFYDKNTRTLTGQVYSSEIGLIEVSSGWTSGISICPSESNIGTMAGDCNIVGKNSNPITLYSPAIWALTWSASGKVDKNSKKIKDLEFKNIGFTGSIFSFSGINLLPKPYHLTGGQFGTGIYLASWSTTIDILQDGFAKAGSLLILTPAWKPLTSPNTVRKTYTTSGFQFTGVDLSLAWVYQYSIIDWDGNESMGEILSIAGNISSTAPLSTTNLIYIYCNDEKAYAGNAIYDRACTNKENLQETQTISDTTTVSKKANDKEGNKVKLLLRDEYGNRIYNQAWLLTIDITRTLKDGYTTLTNIPAELNGWIPPTHTWFPGLRINPIDESINSDWKDTGTTGKLISNFWASATEDPWIQIFSSASGSLKVQWDATTKNITTAPQNINNVSVSTVSEITFKWLIQDNGLIISPTGNILRNRESVFSHKYLISDSGSISTPHLEYIITTSSGEIVDRIRSIVAEPAIQLATVKQEMKQHQIILIPFFEQIFQKPIVEQSILA